MGSTRSRVQLLGGLLALILPAFEAPASAQAVGFQPIPAPLPNGVTLQAAPAVSADRRYVRMGVNAGFNDVRGFQTFSVPAAVSGGGAGMNGPIGGAVAGGGPGAAGVGGLIGGLGGAANFGTGAVGMSDFPFAFAVSGGFGGYGPASGWGDASWNNPGMGGFGGGGMPGAGMGMGMGVPTLPGLGQPLIQDGFQGQFQGQFQGGPMVDPFQQGGPQAGFQQVQAPVQARPDRNAPRSRSSRSRTARAPRRAVAPRRTQAAQARDTRQVPPAVKDATPEAAPEEPQP